MNWLWVFVMAVMVLTGLELLRRGSSKFGQLIHSRLKTLSARLTVAFLISFALFLPFAQLGAGFAQRLLLMVLTFALVLANFIDLENREV